MLQHQTIVLQHWLCRVVPLAHKLFYMKLLWLSRFSTNGTHDPYTIVNECHNKCV